MLIREVAATWHRQYAPFSNDTPLFSERNGISSGVTKKEIYLQLERLDKETATAEDVANVIGNHSWTRMMCDQCKKDVVWLVEVGAEPDYESHTASLCKECVAAIHALLLIEN